MTPLWPLYLSFMIFLTGTVAFSGLAVYLGYFVQPPQNVIPLALAAIFSALVSCGIGESIAKRVHKDRHGS